MAKPAAERITFSTSTGTQFIIFHSKNSTEFLGFGLLKKFIPPEVAVKFRARAIFGFF